jgi:hypothetical protein
MGGSAARADPRGQRPFSLSGVCPRLRVKLDFTHRRSGGGRTPPRAMGAHVWSRGLNALGTVVSRKGRARLLGLVTALNTVGPLDAQRLWRQRFPPSRLPRSIHSSARSTKTASACPRSSCRSAPDRAWSAQASGAEGGRSVRRSEPARAKDLTAYGRARAASLSNYFVLACFRFDAPVRHAKSASTCAGGPRES